MHAHASRKGLTNAILLYPVVNNLHQHGDGSVLSCEICKLLQEKTIWM